MTGTELCCAVRGTRMHWTIALARQSASAMAEASLLGTSSEDRRITRYEFFECSASAKHAAVSVLGLCRSVGLIVVVGGGSSMKEV